MKIEITKLCVRKNEYLNIIIHNKITQNNFHVQIAKIDSDHNEFVMSFDGNIEKNDSNSILNCKSIDKLDKGFYLISSIQVFDYFGQDMDRKNLIEAIEYDDEPYLFKVDYEVVDITYDELKKEYNEIQKVRDYEFNFGIRETLNIENCTNYLGLVFLKNCLMTRSMRLGRYELLPFENLSCESEISIVNSFFSTYGLHINFDLNEVSQNYNQSNPIAVVHFPSVYANTINSAFQMIYNEANTLNNLLSVQRMSNGSILALVLIDKVSGEKFIELAFRNYHGNISGGILSGENPKIIKNRIEKIKDSAHIQLMVSLYNEALNETRNDFEYFRYWNLLEFVARSKEFIGEPLVDWNGNPIKNRKNHIRTLQDTACDLVYELIRRCFIKKQINENQYGDKINYRSMKEQVEIWYRHRNCVVHTGGCQPWNEKICIRDNSKYIECHDAKKELYFNSTENYNFDWYLWIMKFTVLEIINDELDEKIA